MVISRLFSEGLSVVFMVDIVFSKFIVLLLCDLGRVVLMRVIVKVSMVVVLVFWMVWVVISIGSVGVRVYSVELVVNSVMFVSSRWCLLIRLLSCLVLMMRVVVVSR